MIKPEFPPNEETRLETLRALKLLDSEPEERFDRLTRLAKRMFGVPISLVSIVDLNRQWFKSRQGLDATETPRDISFCGHAILGDDIFIIPDTHLDDRFCDNPLVMESPNIRFYAGAPLKVINGSTLGTLCIIDREPREFSDEDLCLLQDLARMAEQEISAMQLATLDELTLISNRRGFNSLARHAISMSHRRGENVTLIFLDLDHFKLINDRFGHAEGDRALVTFSKHLRCTFNEMDVIARIGGDEFAVLVSSDDDESVAHLLQQLADGIKQANREAKRGYNIEYSVGYHTVDAASASSVDDLLEQADKQMYRAKLLNAS